MGRCITQLQQERGLMTYYLSGMRTNEQSAQILERLKVIGKFTVQDLDLS